ncbi:MAG: hypothetical protein KC619_26560 [Myxococcales bacterium]|nr:hypothetical protein [Myxococcales bacterium]
MAAEDPKPNKTATRYLEFSFTLQKHAIPTAPKVWAYLDLNADGQRSDGEVVQLVQPKEAELKWTARFYFEENRAPEGIPFHFGFLTSYGAGNYWDMVVKNDGGKEVAKLDGPVQYNETWVRTTL